MSGGRGQFQQEAIKIVEEGIADEKSVDIGMKKGGELKRISGIFIKRIEDHRKELLSPVTGRDGKTINVVRHNGIEEIGHRWSRMHIRRRTGRSQTAREMGMYGESHHRGNIQWPILNLHHHTFSTRFSITWY